MRTLVLALLLSFAHLLPAAGYQPADRPTLSLDGEWQGRMDPNGVGEREHWFSAGMTFPDKVVVPGCWDNQGFGSEHEKARTNFNGRFWYKKALTLPEGWQGNRIFLRLGGVHRTARVWVNARFLGEHVGYLLAFEYDITAEARAAGALTVAVEVDSRFRPDVDPLHGCADLMDYMGSGYGRQALESGDLNAGATDVTWGGIWGHVTVEARAEAWLENVFVRPQVTPPGITLEAAIGGDPAQAGITAVRLEVVDAAGTPVSDEQFALSQALDAGKLALKASIPNAKLWSFRSPYLYTARVSLLKAAQRADVVSTRFGLREIRIEGPRFLLNGQPIFLNGYGDDCIYPETMAFPSDKETYLRRLRLVKTYGFNYVRHHSHMLPPEYYEACDEVGMFVSAEYPIAYGNRAKGPVADANHRRIMRDTIRRHRNHPSIFNWCMGNEGGGDTLRQDFLRIVREEDPTRLFIDTDGLWPGSVPNGENRDSLDFFVLQFDIMNTPLDIPGIYSFTDMPIKPVVSHETGNYCTFPRFDQISFFRGSIKPFWLEFGQRNYEALGLLPEAGRFSYNSERLYARLHKRNLEALRKNPRISGYHWWLFQDYWTTSNGLVDSHYRPKAIWPDEVKEFNNDIVVLENGLDLNYRSGDPLRTELLVSNFGEAPLAAETLTWRLRVGPNATASGVVRKLEAPLAELSRAGIVEAVLPRGSGPEQITLEVEMSAGARRIRNHWSAWVFPTVTESPALKSAVYASPVLLEDLGLTTARPLPEGPDLPAPAVYVAQRATSNLLNAVERGATLVLLSPARGFATESTRFKQPWWHAQPGLGVDEGTVVYEHPILAGLAPEGWLDEGFYRLIEGARGVRIEGWTEKPAVLVRSILDPRTPGNKALLFEARLGQGALIVSAFNHRKAHGYPENDWLLRRILEYADTNPKPAARVSLPVLPPSSPVPAQPGIPLAEGFMKVITPGEQFPWFTALEDNAETYICRQDGEGHLVSWQTSRVPKTIADGFTFVFAGGLGYKSQPPTPGFELLVNGKPVLGFDISMSETNWVSADGQIEMHFRPVRVLDQDALGYFYVRIAKPLLTPGQSCTLGVRSQGTGSRRWFALHPYPDLLD